MNNNTAANFEEAKKTYVEAKLTSFLNTVTAVGYGLPGTSEDGHVSMELKLEECVKAAVRGGDTDGLTRQQRDLVAELRKISEVMLG